MLSTAIPKNNAWSKLVSRIYPSDGYQPNLAQWPKLEYRQTDSIKTYYTVAAGGQVVFAGLLLLCAVRETREVVDRQQKNKMRLRH